MKSIINLIILLITLNAFSQSEKKIFGYITDAETNQPIENAQIYFENSKITTISDKNGFYSINIINVPSNLIISHVSYEKREILIKTSVTQKIDIELINKINSLPIVTISSPSPKKVLNSESFIVEDYNFIDTNIIILGHYPTKKPELILIATNGDTICKKTIYETTEKLFKDCFDNVHLITENNAYQVFVEEKTINLIHQISIKDFEKFISPCIEKLNNLYVFKEYFYNNQILMYYTKTENSEEKKLEVIADQKALRILSDKDRFESMGKKFSESDLRFEEMFFYDPIYCPIFKINNSLIIFNFVDSKIMKYNSTGDYISSINFTFNKQKNWKEQMAYDEIKNKTYSIFIKNGIISLKEIDLNTGELANNISIPNFPFIEKIKVNNGNVYFIYHNLIKEQNRMLYKMEIK